MPWPIRDESGGGMRERHVNSKVKKKVGKSGGLGLQPTSRETNPNSIYGKTIRCLWLKKKTYRVQKKLLKKVWGSKKRCTREGGEPEIKKKEVVVSVQHNKPRGHKK